MVWVKVDPEPIVETLEVRREYTLSRRPVHPRTPRKHTFTPRGNLAKSPVQEFGRNWRTRRKPIWTQDERDILYPILGFNWGLWSCESAMLPTAPPCRPDLNLMFITYCIFSALSFISDFYLFGILLFFLLRQFWPIRCIKVVLVLLVLWNWILSFRQARSSFSTFYTLSSHK